MPNQYTLARDAGITPDHPDWPKQAETRRPHPEEVREKIRVGNIIARLEKIIEESEQEANVISASKILLDKTLSSLTAVDQTNRDATEAMDEASLVAKLRAVAQKNPQLMSQILGDIARQAREEDKEGKAA
jgi:hypothetical protein